jgi:glycine cleavage system H protein
MADAEEFIPFMGYEWIQIENGTVTVGISEDGLNELGEITAINLPSENEDVNPDEICGEIETDEGPMNLYSPVEGKIIEINAAVVENPSLLLEDPYGDGWLFRVEAEDAEDLEDIDEDEDEEDEDEDEDEEDDD